MTLEFIAMRVCSVMAALIEHARRKGVFLDGTVASSSFADIMRVSAGLRARRHAVEISSFDC